MMVGAPPEKSGSGEQGSLSKSGEKKPADDKSQPAKPEARGAGDARDQNYTPQLGTFRPRDILARNLAADVQRELKSGGYALHPGSSDDVTRLVPPPWLRVQEELPRLEERYANQTFGLNYIYQSDRSALGRAERRTGGEPARTGGCQDGRCYGPDQIGWSSTLSACAAGVKVGVIDTDVQSDHPALAAKGLTVIRNPQDAARKSSNWHGTGVVALLAGSPGSGTPGLIPHADFRVVDAFFENSAGQTETDTDHLIWALDKLDAWGAKVINMSLAGPRDSIMHARLIEMTRKGVVFVAAAGNSGSGGAPAYPAAYRREVIAVTAVDSGRAIIRRPRMATISM